MDSDGRSPGEGGGGIMEESREGWPGDAGAIWYSGVIMTVLERVQRHTECHACDAALAVGGRARSCHCIVWFLCWPARQLKSQSIERDVQL